MSAEEQKLFHSPEVRVVEASAGSGKTYALAKRYIQILLNPSLKIIESQKQTGFNLGIISDLKFAKYLSLRFVPDLSFAQRDLEYHFDTIITTKRIESTFLDFPLDIKFKSSRLNNGGAYLLGGGKYSIDLVSQKNVKNNIPGQEIVKLRKNDFAYEVGGGIEFYLTYFKFAIEGKLSIGIKNLLVKDSTIYSKSDDKLRSKIFLISFTFEG